MAKKAKSKAKKPVEWTFADDRERWDRQRGETGKAFEAFKAFRDLPYDVEVGTEKLSTRRISTVAKLLQKSGSLLRRWSRRWKWPERVEAYDVWIATVDAEGFAVERKLAASRLERRRVVIKDRAWSLLGRTFNRIEELLRIPLFEEEVEEDEENRIIYIMKPTKQANYTTFARMVHAARQLSDLVVSMDESPLDQYLEDLDLDALTEEQIDQIVEGADPIKVILQGYRASAPSESEEAEVLYEPEG